MVAYLATAVSQSDGYADTYLALYLRIRYIFHTLSLAEIGLRLPNAVAESQVD